ncbi:adenylosuccinate synthetase [Acetobacter persici]|uniref:adenylosuccinate synthetase n=1 Tax=Acetobacter persici TaxID=1076596 RepID=UPI0020CB80B4|nr:adenylosuccinate synthetase [Acetobacter persici]MCP9318606.1 adenylosuccinate synthetase [Acetobacter persici]
MDHCKIATAVIGAAWGDEGKGLLTDAFSDSSTVVIRHNSGAQAGHTVQMDDGRRHVFHHFGSGTFRGAATYLSQFFVCNPLAFGYEKKALTDATDTTPTVYAHPDCLVTTPWDMMLNQMAEEARGSARHGSCGMGFNETIQRSRNPHLALTVGNIVDMASLDLCKYLDRIRNDYVPARLKELGITPSQAWSNRLASPGALSMFMDACANFLGTVLITRDAKDDVFTKSKKIVFEGAQGLLLDARRGTFPYVTNSRTGLTNIVSLAHTIGLETLQIIHATRAYATRHGAGPFLRESPELKYEDNTNLPNEWQGTLRFGELDIDLLTESIRLDYADQSLSELRIERCLAVTCLDQVGHSINYWDKDARKTTEHAEFLECLRERSGVQNIITSHGPTRSCVSL